MNVCLYMRMSTNMQENSIESQQNVLRAYAKSHKMHIVAEYVDEGISGRKADKRPAFMQMIEDSHKDDFEAVLIYDSSRFARNLEESIVYKSLLKRNNVDLISATEPVLDEDTSVMTDALLGAMNEMYSRKLSKNVRRGMDFKVSQGYFQNKPPFGYRKVTGTQVAQIDEEGAEIVRMIFELFTTSMPTYFTISNELNRQGIKTQYKSLWVIRDIKRILENTSYIGYIPWHGDKTLAYKGKHQPIISEEIFFEAQKIIKGKKTHKGRDSATYAHWLSGIIRCSFCGRNLGFNPQRSPELSRFRCIGNSHGLCRPTNSVSVKKAEATIMQILQDVVNSTYVINFENIIHKEVKKDNKELLNSNLQKLEQKLKRYRNAYSEGVDTLEEYKINKAETMRDIENIQAQLKTMCKKASYEDSIKIIKNQSLNLLNLLQTPDFSIMQKSNALKNVIHHIVYDKNADKFIVFFNG